MGKALMPPLAAFFFLALLVSGSPVRPAPAATADSPGYLALGDSLAFGIGAPDPVANGYVGLAYRSLEQSQRYRDQGLDLINLAAPGATSSDLLLPGGQLDVAIGEITRRQNDAAPSNDVEVISVDIGGNDLLTVATPDSPCFKDPAGQACRERFGTVLASLQANLTQVLRRLRETAPSAGVYVLDLYNPYSGTGHPLETIAEFAVQQLNGVIGAVVADPQFQAKMGDVFQLFSGRGNQWVAADGLHPNADGHKVMAEVLLATIDNRAPVIPRELLAESPGATGDPVAGTRSGNSDDDGISSLLLLAIAVPISFGAGALMTGAYFLARGRPS